MPPAVIKSPNGQYWVVNTSPPGRGPGGAARTQYTICEGTFGQCSALPDGGGISGPYFTLDAAYAAWKAEPQNKDTSTLDEIRQALGGALGGAIGNLPAGVQAGAGNIPNPLAGLAAIGDFFQRLTQASTWIRVAEVLLGLILLAAGTARITRAIPAATRIAAAVGTKGLA